MRTWSIEIWLLDDQGNEVMPNVFEKAVYNLHPSFEKPKHGACAMQSYLDYSFADPENSPQEASFPYRGEGLG